MTTPTPTPTPTTATDRLIKSGSATIFVTDLERAVRFYTTALGLDLQYRAGDHFAMVDAGGGLSIGLHPPGPRTPEAGSCGSTQVGLTVSRPIEEVVATLQERDVRFETHDGLVVVDDSAVKLAFFFDPDGNKLYLCEVKHGG